METLRFSIPEILSLLGVAQCLYILVYMIFRSGKLSRGTLPAVYFAVLGLAFLMDAAYRFWGGLLPAYSHLQWLFWFSGPPLSALLIIQIARITKVPEPHHYLILLLIPAAYILTFGLVQMESECHSFLRCEKALEWLNITGLIMGAISLLAIWMHRTLIDSLMPSKSGKERFWLIMVLILLNVMFLSVMLGVSWNWIEPETAHLMRTGLGIAFIYTASTSLLRLYPQAMRVDEGSANSHILSDDDISMALKIEKLIYQDKVYQEPSYGRAELARELGLSEAVLSRIVNQYFEKTVPNLLNQLRVGEAKDLLKQTTLPVHEIAEVSGFNSLASFNRVFKEMTGVTPSEYRKKEAA